MLGDEMVDHVEGCGRDPVHRDDLAVGAGDQHDEFVPAHAGQGVAFTDLVLQSARNFDKHTVTDRVPPRIVHNLKSIKVQVAHGKGRPFPSCLRQRDHHSVSEQSPIGRPSQWIEVRNVLQLAGVISLLGYIHRQSNETLNLAASVNDAHLGNLKHVFAAVNERDFLS